MSIIAWIVLGLVAGWLAGMLMKGHSYGVVANIVVGILGAILGGWVASAMLGLDVTRLNLTSIVVATLGAILLILILRAVPEN